MGFAGCCCSSLSSSSSSLARNSLAFFTKSQYLFLTSRTINFTRKSSIIANLHHDRLLHYPSSLHHRDCTSFYKKSSHLSTVAIPAKVRDESSSNKTDVVLSKKMQKKLRFEAPENKFKFNLEMCSRHGDLIEALRLYDDAKIQGIKITQHHYNMLLYLCSSGVDVKGEGDTSDENVSKLGLERGFEIYKQMNIDKIAPNEATFTSVARLAAKMEDPEMAFDLIKKMMSYEIVPKLRSYGPALYGFCKKGEADKAYEVDAHMVDSGVIAEEPELAALLQVSSNVGRGEKVYELLHRLRSSVRQVVESTAEIVEDWFKSDKSIDVGKENWDVREVKNGVVKGGGGWHGIGWLGKGKWNVVRTEMNEDGVCRTCGEKLVCIDIDPLETKNFATSLSNLAGKREVKAEFNKFQEWLHRSGPFDAVIDGANIGLLKARDLNFAQLNRVANRIRELSPSKKLPLIILHSRRVYGGPAEKPINKKLIESWQKSGALYATPVGSNDDWYWLYAAVSCNSLLVTNDEMRDHLFQLLGTNFFPRWKEKHQVRLSVSSEKGLTLHMPPPYSIVIQESEGGSWHVPTVTGDDIENPRQWVCATRASASVPPPSTKGSNPSTKGSNISLAEKTLRKLKLSSSHS
ncbi:proteinaceous RNase P 1, chloroplastic/mitochondrial-like [Papaver somniferum]|uniref:proteinaceous RNase P 1, chloroplastic/mitochondrial-like n=1 Tax=Papaver somniferum TaxID=3469 RepID=UPI000E6F9150|nr:proteinaceous RNase P 1, chloroplastic/mitochondrial-like [Papaver somniferum]